MKLFLAATRTSVRARLFAGIIGLIVISLAGAVIFLGIGLAEANRTATLAASKITDSAASAPPSIAPSVAPSASVGPTAAEPTPTTTAPATPTPPVQKAPSKAASPPAAQRPAAPVAPAVPAVPSGPSAADIAQNDAVRRQLQAEKANLVADLASIGSDLAKDQQWLTVANAYGDTLRAGVLNADIAALNARQIGSQNSLDQVNTSLATLPSY